MTYCNNDVYLDVTENSSPTFGTMGLFAGFLLVLASMLMFITRPDSLLISGGIAFIGVSVLGIVDIGYGAISAMIALIIFVIMITRYSRRIEWNYLDIQ